MSEKTDLKTAIKKIKPEYVLIAILVVVALIIATGGLGKKDEGTVSVIDGYVSTLEGKLKKSLSLVKGAGKVDVIISVESGMETVLATEKITSDGSVKETPVTVGGKTVVITESYPKISGVVIVSEGASNLSVRVSLINATACFLDIDSDKIQVLTRKS